MSAATRGVIQRRAFSLLELVVVIGIIVVLAGLVLGVATTVVAQSELRQAANTIALVDAAIEEHQTVMGRPITFGTNGPNEVYDIQASLIDGNIIVETIRLIDGNETARTILSRINPDFLRQVNGTSDGSREVIDPWDLRLMVVYPGRTWNGPADGTRDLDGTLRTSREEIYGICANRKVLIVSAGPDGRFGNLSGPTTEDIEQAGDNVYSYEPVKP